MVGGFRSEWWARSDQNAGRLQIGIGGRLTSEFAVTGIVVHDHWKPYYTMTGVLHALCNAHHLRELKALVEIEKEDWAHRMQRLLRRACHAANLARSRAYDRSLPGMLRLCYKYLAHWQGWVW
jgi:hypothetical protein